MTFEEAFEAAMLAPLEADSPECVCQCSGGGLSRTADGEYKVEPLQWQRIPLCPVHGIPAQRRWWQTQKGAERARLEAFARTF